MKRLAGIKKGLLTLMCVLPFASPLLAQHQADSYYDPAAMARAREELMHHHGSMLNYLILGERLENHFNDGEQATVWEAQGWVGRDTDKLWLKTEGEHDFDAGELEQAELQVLYSRAISPYWDLQAGLRHDFEPGPSRSHLAMGLQGLAPQWFEVDAAAFLDADGRLSARLEAEYDLRLTQRLFLQPRLELNHAFDAAPEAGLGRGIRGSELGLRLRYEFRREFAPYLGLAWEQAHGETADLLRRAGEDPSEFSVLLGLRFWY